MEGERGDCTVDPRILNHVPISIVIDDLESSSVIKMPQLN